jgi:chloramphenicol O-acetyltransferase type A
MSGPAAAGGGRHLDLATWPRRATFDFFRRFDKPYFNVCLRLDLTALVALKSRLPGGLMLAYHHLVMRLANEIEPFRYRVDGDRVRVLDVVHASVAVLRHDESIGFAYLAYDPDPAAFAGAAGPVVDAVVRGDLPFDPGLDQAAHLHFTTLPWVDFSSFSHARNWGREDSIPKFAFGRLQREGDRWAMALSIEVHHALMDGLHVGRLVQGLEERLRNPAPWVGASP